MLYRVGKVIHPINNLDRVLNEYLEIHVLCENFCPQCNSKLLQKRAARSKTYASKFQMIINAFNLIKLFFFLHFSPHTKTF